MADITPPLPQDRQLIQSYGGGGFRIAGQDHSGSVLIRPEATLAWPVAQAHEIDIANLDPLIAGQGDGTGGILLVGTGRRIVPLAVELRVELRRRGIGLEVMDTGAACRTFNVLLAEERAVLAALIAVP